MNDYSLGSLEALSWARALLRKCSTVEDFKTARETIIEVWMRIASGSAVNFKDKAERIQEL